MFKPSVLVTFDSMKNPNSGYFSFGKGLGDELILQNKDRFELAYYMFKNTSYKFDGKVPLMDLSRLHNVFFPSRNKFDVVHFTDQTCRLKPYSVNAKRIMTIHDINKVHLAHTPQRKIDAHISKLRKYMSYCDKVVAISKFVADDVLKFIPEIEDKISVIYNGADKPQVPENYLPTYHPKRQFIFTIGLLSPQKGFHLIPPLLVGNDFELVIAGIETPHKLKIIEVAEQFGVADRVIITGPVNDNDRAWYYNNCSAFVFPSIAEGFGLPVIEAMNCGKPVFLSKFTSLPEIGGNVAYYFDDFDPINMQNVFFNGMQDFNEYNRSAGIIKHAAIFSWEAAANQYLELYQDCLNDN